jgi:hypothetical protein
MLSGFKRRHGDVGIAVDGSASFTAFGSLRKRFILRDCVSPRVGVAHDEYPLNAGLLLGPIAVAQAPQIGAIRKRATRVGVSREDSPDAYGLNSNTCGPGTTTRFSGREFGVERQSNLPAEHRLGAAHGDDARQCHDQKAERQSPAEDTGHDDVILQANGREPGPGSCVGSALGSQWAR